jgi:lactate dehydrogenase-like 2-hydroxyacid dehydrogenase
MQAAVFSAKACDSRFLRERNATHGHEPRFFDARLQSDTAPLALDVCERQADLFFEDLSNETFQDDVFRRLLTFPNVLVTGHQAIFARQALANIADATLGNLSDFEQGRPLANRIGVDHLVN